jgi:RNA polymerase sigma-70 factor (ECF subfamily)
MVRRQPTLLSRARRGEREALAELWRTHQAALVRYLRARRCPAPDDVASQVWIAVAASLHRFEGDDDDFRRWLFTIAHRRSVDEIRRTVRRDGLSVRAADVAVATTAGADVEYERNGALDRAIALVATLPDDMAEAVMLRVVNELPVADVASVMGTTDGNVRVLVHRGLSRLRRKISVTDATSPTMSSVT